MVNPNTITELKSIKPDILLGREYIVKVALALGIDSLRIRRVIIDAQHDNAVLCYVEFFGDERLYDIEIPEMKIVSTIDNGEK